MTETILLVIMGLVLSLGIFGGKKLIAARHIQPLTSRTEAIIRLALMLIAALIAHIIFARPGNMVWYALAVIANAFVAYGATHFFERLFFKP